MYLIESPVNFLILFKVVTCFVVRIDVFVNLWILTYKCADSDNLRLTILLRDKYKYSTQRRPHKRVRVRIQSNLTKCESEHQNKQMRMSSSTTTNVRRYSNLPILRVEQRFMLATYTSNITFISHS